MQYVLNIGSLRKILRLINPTEAEKHIALLKTHENDLSRLKSGKNMA
jgi:hypothetical protein